MKTRVLKNHAIQEGTFFLLLGGWLMYYSLDNQSRARGVAKDWSQSPNLFPVIIAVLLAVLAVWLLGQGIAQARTAEDAAKPAKTQGQPLTVLVVLAMTAAYYAVLALVHLPYLGTSFGTFTLAFSTFELATIVFLFLLLFYLKVRSKPVLIAVPILTTVVLSVLFRSALHVMLP